MKDYTIKELNYISKEIRKKVVEMAYNAKSSHVGSALSIVDILVVLYYKQINIDPIYPQKEDRDIFILSKGHACSALYATLAYRGFFSIDLLDTYQKSGYQMYGHPKRLGIPGVEVSTGSLGHGLSIGCGIALSNMNDEKPNKTIVLLGDGECNEGSIWEATMFASSNKLNNLIAIIDSNKLQGFGKVEEIVLSQPLYNKWLSFGWNVIEIDGHNYSEINNSIKLAFSNKTDKPTIIIANTIKGKGVSFMENKLQWHYKSPSKSELEAAITEVQSL
ncbi:transketolase [Clostridium sp. FP2]|uniref:transketolase n=1 Tax=Clostridium sp. FP2 TaxID=2724481 RepID=UPI0013E90D55|nr:transketolase [Clostridium sp. FP2]MBZ9624564.1 transketolase [Clostridium sp. FP2]